MNTKNMIVGITVCVLVSAASWATTYYVDPNGDDTKNGLSWANAFATIQKAIDTASNYDTIDVNEGTYYEAIDFKGKRVTVQSTDYDDWEVVAATIIDANGASTAVEFTSSESSSAKLLGLTVTGASRRGIDCDDSHPRIEYCLITGNGDGSYDGAGMRNRHDAYPYVENCIFHNNHAHEGGGMYNYDYSDPEIDDCLFVANKAYDGGGICNEEDCDPEIENCTFFGNEADDDGGGMYNEDDCDPDLYNCIFWDNTADDDGNEVYNYDAGSNPDWENCDIKGCGGSGAGWDPNFGDDEGGNLDSDPCFVDSSDPNGQDDKWGTSDDGLELLIDSPCIDAADSAADWHDLLGRNRVDICGIENTGSDNDAADIGAYERQDPLYISYGMEIVSVSGDSSEVTVKTNGAKYVLTPTDMNMYCRIDVNTNTTFADGNERLVARLEFGSNIGSLSIDWYDDCKAVIESTKATFEFESDSLFFITAKDSFSYDHNSIIANPVWNAPLDPNDWEVDANDRMWTDGYGGSLHAKVSGSPGATATVNDVNSTTISMSSGDKTAHMVYPPKTFDFEGLYGESARPFINFMYQDWRMDQFVDGTVDVNDYIDNDFGVFLIWNYMYTNQHYPVLLDSNIMGYDVNETWESSVTDFIDFAHDKGFKVISYLSTPSSSRWKYPSGHPKAGQRQEISVTVDWMKSFQEEYDLDGWYFDNGDAGGFLDDYEFMRQVRTDIGANGIIHHHDSVDVWDEWLKKYPPGEMWDYRGLRAIMVNVYVSYTFTGETGTIARVDEPNDQYFRFFSCGYGMSQAYGSALRKSDRTLAISEEEKVRVMGENLNGTDSIAEVFSNKSCWQNVFKKAYDVRKAEYLNDANVPFVPDVNWPIDGSTGWFRTATNVTWDVNDTNVEVSWTTPDVNSDSEVAYTNHQVWDKCYTWSRADGPDGVVSDSNVVTNHTVPIPFASLVAGDPYEFRISSNNGDSNIPGEIIWGNLGSFIDPNIMSRWKFDETSGSTAADSVGSNDGTVYGAQWDTGGHIDGALSFDGDGDYINIGDDVKPSLPISVSMWIEPNSLGTNQFLFENDEYNGSNYYGIWAYIKDTNAISIAYGDGGSPASWNRRSKVSSSTVSPSEWQHIAFVISGATDMDIYINGADAGGTYSGTGSALAYSSASGNIGSRAGSSYFFDGSMDDVRVYDRALSGEEIDQLYYRDCTFDPIPSDGAQGVKVYANLYWKAGTNVTGYDVYLGTDENAVENASDPDTAPGKGRQQSKKYDGPTNLAYNETYYWRIDEVRSNNAVLKGRVWSLTTESN
ncbi:MAG: LamG-like jellyroll fold domain-containing protein [Planctomycetota bacterium]